MTDRVAANTPQRIATLQRMFSKNRTHRKLEERFLNLLERRRVELQAGMIAEARCIALIGASGSGKTRAAEHLFATQPDLVLHNCDSSRLDIASFQVPSPATLKFVGQTALETLGYELRRDRSAQIIWSMVKAHLQARRTMFLHIDEAQDLMRHQTPRELNAVVSTLKSLLQHKSWPVGLLLTGTAELKTLINHDPQLARRVFPIEVARLNILVDSDRILKAIAHYAKAAGIAVSADTLNPDLAARLVHAADREFGLMNEMIIQSLEEAMITGDEEVRREHFTSMFRKRAGCVDGLNVFVDDDFERIDVRRLLDHGDDA
ncbi:ATP-binding protein [Paracoccus sp. 1_MG-2023]|uniref:ATP-binding protein n=1 Tax=unclassified Paracoccus (in: a-proteobacteria) TaxID=2688777 RepID=UPI001C0824FE|nr:MULTISPECIES: ATP-binding protein [unclassified Paracoccus (in: a-proteobacteria)]MBU2957163.1 TniB family NTP-binding protein [Paracoccus sp. C2R09]MDO6670340.1 ATP-binding protein [Paracoccus sp. 1_MG-2023]